MAWIYSGLFLAWIMFFISQWAAVFVVMQLEKFESDLLSAESFPRHQILMFICGVVLNGQSMVIFRLLPGFRTQFLKFLHFLIHTFIAGVVGYEFYLLRDENKMENVFGKLHSYMALLVAAAYVLQWVLAFFIYLCIFSYQRRRMTFAAWHNFLGICILQLTIATIAVTMRRMDRNEVADGDFIEPICVGLCVTYGLLINAIVLNPYVEWPLIGPL